MNENKFPAPNELLLMLLCAVIGKKQAGDYKTGEKQTGSQYRDACYSNGYKLQLFLNGQKTGGDFAVTRPEQHVLCGLRDNAFTAFRNKVT